MFAAMAIHSWFILASVLLVSVGGIFGQRPQTFFESSSPSPQLEHRQTKEFILYLTSEQAQALEAGGALVKPQPDLADRLPENDESQINEEQNELQYERDNNEQEQKEDVDLELEEFFKILNEEREDEQREQEQATEKPRVIPGQFRVYYKSQENQQEENKAVVPPLPKKIDTGKTYSYVRFLKPSEESQKLKPKPNRAQLLTSYYSEKNEESTEKKEDERPEVGPVPENQEENIPAYVAPHLQNRNIAARIIQQKSKLLQNELELQTKLRELYDAPKRNDQKYAIEVERLRSNLEKQNALSRAQAGAKGIPILIKEEITVRPRRPDEVEKQAKVQVPRLGPITVRISETFGAKGSQAFGLPAGLQQPVPIPFVKTDNNKVEKPAPVEEKKRVPFAITKNVYVKVKKPYLVEHFVPVELKKEIPVQVPIHKPEKLTIVRHVWEH